MHKNPLNPNALRGTISTSFRAIGAREEQEEFARRLYDLSLEPEVHRRSRRQHVVYNSSSKNSNLSSPSEQQV
jgi:hypothetical protein